MMVRCEISVFRLEERVARRGNGLGRDPRRVRGSDIYGGAVYRADEPKRACQKGNRQSKTA